MERIRFSSTYTHHLARTLQLLGDETRLQIVLCLAQGEANVSELCQFLELAQSTVSHHLGLLRLAGLVTTRREGRLVFYAIHQNTWQAIASQFFDQIPNPGMANGSVSNRSVQLDRFILTEVRTQHSPNA